STGCGGIWDRAVADCKPGLFRDAVSVDQPRVILCEETVALAAQDRLIEDAELTVDFRPDLAERLSQRARVAIAAQGAVSVVVDHDQSRPPPNGHGQARRQDEIDAPFQGLRPVY